MDDSRPIEREDTNDDESFSSGYTHVTTFNIEPIVGSNSVVKSRFNLLIVTAFDEHLENINTFCWRIINTIIVGNNLSRRIDWKSDIGWSHKKATSMLS